jgi:recombination protein RecA
MAGKKSSSVKFGSALDKWSQFVTKASEMERHPYISLGPLSVNLAVGNPKGIEMGRIIQLVGKPSSGKSTLSLDIIRQYQQEHNADVFYIDFERSFDPEYAQSCGVDIERVFRIHPDTTEQGFDIAEAVLQEEEHRLIVVDSVAAARPSSEDGKAYGDNPKMASSAGLLTRFCNRINPLLDNTGSTLIMINQLRKNFSMMSPETEIPFGGMALSFYTALTIHLTRIKSEDIRQTVQAVIQKNKKGAPKHRTEFKIVYGLGVDHIEDILTLAEQYNIIQKGGAWYTYGDLKVQGLQRAGEQFPIKEITQKVLEVV